MAGWGFTEKLKLPNVLMKGILNATKYCDDFNKINSTLKMTEKQFCAKGKHETKNLSIQTCKGDSGSGASFHNEKELFYVLYGVTSYGVIGFLARCGLDRPPTVFVNVFEYVEWILDNVEFS